MKRLFVTFIAVMAILPYVEAEDLIPVRDSADAPNRLPCISPYSRYRFMKFRAAEGEWKQ